MCPPLARFRARPLDSSAISPPSDVTSWTTIASPRPTPSTASLLPRRNTPRRTTGSLWSAGAGRQVRRCYRDGTLILETEFETEEGSVTVVDLMPIYGEGTDVLRIVT
jgi:hypothetical protein